MLQSLSSYVPPPTPPAAAAAAPAAAIGGFLAVCVSLSVGGFSWVRTHGGPPRKAKRLGAPPRFVGV